MTPIHNIYSKALEEKALILKVPIRMMDRIVLN